MASSYTRKKLWRHGSVSVALTVITVAATILANSIFSTLAERYGWFINMNPAQLYPVSSSCFDYLDEFVMNDTQKKIDIIFCDEQKNIEASQTQTFILNTATEIAEKYPEQVQISYLNIWEQPKKAKEYGVTASSDVIFICEGRSRVCKLRDFFVFSVSDTSVPLAYMGDKRFASAMNAVTSDDTPMCYFTVNHGESFPDYEILYAAIDAGYTVSYLDMLSYDIPNDCEMLITYDPVQDLTADGGVSGISEVARLQEYMANGGRYAVFVSADTFVAGGLENFENFLSEWGVSFEHKTGEDGIEECASVRDPQNALSTDGYTFLADTASKGRGGNILNGIDGAVRVSNATIITPAADFLQNQDGNYVSGNYTLTPLLSSFKGAQSWAAGRATAIADDGFMLMTLTESAGDSPGYLLACSSTGFANEKSMQSAVYDNKDVLLSVFAAMGKEEIPIGIHSQPFSDSEIRILTTSDARNITVMLTVIPVAILLATGLVVLIRRRYA